MSAGNSSTVPARFRSRSRSAGISPDASRTMTRTPIFGLPLFGHGLEADIVRHDGTPELACTFQQGVILELRCSIVLRGNYIHSSQAQLGGDGVIDVNVEIESDGH